MIKGITVTLITRTQNGTDPMGAPIYKESTASVDNVLVAPTSSDDVVNQQSLTGRKAVYTLAIPKGDTNTWENQVVEFFGKRWKAFGIPTQGIDDLIPLSWNKKVMVERYE
jgi:hypothetical protein